MGIINSYFFLFPVPFLLFFFSSFPRSFSSFFLSLFSSFFSFLAEMDDAWKLGVGNGKRDWIAEEKMGKGGEGGE